MKFGVIGGSAIQLSSRGMVDLNILNGRGKTMAVQAVVLPQVTTHLPSRWVSFNRKWKHLSSVDLLLRADVFGHPLLHGRRFSPSATSFDANTAMKQNALEHIVTHSHVVQAVLDSFY